MKYLKLFFVVATIVVLGYFVFGEMFLPSDGPEEGWYVCEEYNSGWVSVDEDGNRRAIDIPGSYSGNITIEGKLPDTFSDDTNCICFRGSDMKIYIDGVLKEEYSTDNTRLFGVCSTEAYVMASLLPEDAGKTVVVEMRQDSGILYPVYIGNRLGIWRYFFCKYGIELVIALVTLALGIGTILGSLVLHRIYRRSIELGYLGFGVSIAAVWILTNSVFRQIIFSSISVVGDIPFAMIALLPFPFLIYMNEVQKQRYRKSYFIMEILNMLNILISVGLHVANIVNFRDSFLIIAACCLISISMIFVTMIKDFKNKMIKEYRLIAVGLLCAFVAAVVQIVSYFGRTGVFSGAILSVGLLLLLVFSVIDTIVDIFHMEREKKDALSASESKGRFLANMSHEIRTPINAVLGMNAMILRESSEDNIREYAMDIQNAGQTLLALINDILDFSKIESGKMELVPVEYDLSSTIHDIMNMITIKAEDKGLYLKLFVDSKLPSRLYGDDTRLRQVMINILNNAVKYTNEGGITFTITGEKQDENVLLHVSVEDTGIGIKEEDISKLFSEFERIDESNNRNVEGSGLGMNISRQLIDMMGGKLNVSSVYGSGSTFSFDVEQKIIDASPVGNLEERIRQQAQNYEYSAVFTAPDAKVLLVDDNAVNRKVFVNLLKETQVKIDEASSGQECLYMVCRTKYDVIFLDHMMPVMDGIETLHRLKKLPKNKSANAPVLALTANAVSGAREMYLSEGFNDFVTKPIVPEKLEKILAKYLPKYMVRIGAGHDVPDRTETSSDDVNEKLELVAKIPEINLSYAGLFNKNPEFQLELLKDFYKMIEPEARQLQQYYDDIDNNPEALKQYRVKVHSMKSSAAMVGAVGLSGMALSLEKSAEEEKVEVVKSLSPVFVEEWLSYKEKLAFLGDSKTKTDEQNVEGNKQVEEELSDSNDASEDGRDSILVVDDSVFNLKVAQDILERQFNVHCCKSGKEAIEYLSDRKNAKVDLILLDLHMPDMDGFEVIDVLKSKEKLRRIPVIFLTADSNQEAEVKGFEKGAADFITKPFVPEIMLQRVCHIVELSHLQNNLSREVKKQSRISEEQREKVEKLALQAMKTLVAAIDAKDKYTNGHSLRVAKYSKLLAARMGKNEREQEEIYYIGLLHDVGKIGIPDEIINKPSRLTDEEFGIIKTHPVIGDSILQNISEIPNVAVGARWHHERYDGKGYPDGLVGNDIPEVARIIGVADAYDAMTSNRSYRVSLSQQEVRKEVEKGIGTQFDPVIAGYMLNIIDDDTEYELKEKV